MDLKFFFSYYICDSVVAREFCFLVFKWRPIFMQIIEKDCAYAVEGDVFFAVDKSPNYGQLSGQRLENNRAGERVAVDSRKRNPADFALWKV